MFIVGIVLLGLYFALAIWGFCQMRPQKCRVCGKRSNEILVLEHVCLKCYTRIGKI